MKTVIPTSRRALFLFCSLIAVFGLMAEVAVAEEVSRPFDQVIDDAVAPLAKGAGEIVFFSVPVGQDDKGNTLSVPLVLILLAGTAVFLTVFFKFINLRSIGMAVGTIRGKYTDPDAPGQITHFQALSAALSATVGLGNIAGVAIAIGIGGPGATLWMIVLGFLGMTTKFCECTLGVKYREIDEQGRVHGGAMYYLSKGLKEHGFGALGYFLAGFFALMCIGGAFGAGNMFQVNQAREQVQNTFGFFEESNWQFGAIMAVIVGAVIIGGIKSIARVASVIVPFMCVTYIIAAFVVVIWNADKIGEAISTIVTYAFAPHALIGGVIGVLIQGVKRAAFSNEAGLGSAPIAHAAVKTDRPASEGLVALLEPLVDTVVVCTMTALVIVTTGMWKVNATVNADGPTVMLAAPDAESDVIAQLPADTYLRHIEEKKGADDKAEFYKVFQVDTANVGMAADDGRVEGWVSASALEVRSGNSGGVWLTSQSFGSVISWFPYVLTVAVVLFCFSTMISWSYYGEQAVIYLFGRNRWVILGYNTVFCCLVVVGAAASLGNILDLSDAMIFAMVFPNLIGLYFLLPVVRKELKSYTEHVKNVKKGGGE